MMVKYFSQIYILSFSKQVFFLLVEREEIKNFKNVEAFRVLINNGDYQEHSTQKSENGTEESTTTFTTHQDDNKFTTMTRDHLTSIENTEFPLSHEVKPFEHYNTSESSFNFTSPQETNNNHSNETIF